MIYYKNTDKINEMYYCLYYLLYLLLCTSSIVSILCSTLAFIRIQYVLFNNRPIISLSLLEKFYFYQTVVGGTPFKLLFFFFCHACIVSLIQFLVVMPREAIESVAFPLSGRKSNGFFASKGVFTGSTVSVCFK